MSIIDLGWGRPWRHIRSGTLAVLHTDGILSYGQLAVVGLYICWLEDALSPVKSMVKGQDRFPGIEAVQVDPHVTPMCSK